MPRVMMDTGVLEIEGLNAIAPEERQRIKMCWFLNTNDVIISDFNLV